VEILTEGTRAVVQLSIGRKNKDDGLSDINLKPNNSNLRTQTFDVMFSVRYVLSQQQTSGQPNRQQLCVFTVKDERGRVGEAAQNYTLSGFTVCIFRQTALQGYSKVRLHKYILPVAQMGDLRNVYTVERDLRLHLCLI
jgi:hypothetical protein